MIGTATSGGYLTYHRIRVNPSELTVGWAISYAFEPVFAELRDDAATSWVNRASPLAPTLSSEEFDSKARIATPAQQGGRTQIAQILPRAFARGSIALYGEGDVPEFTETSKLRMRSCDIVWIKTSQKIHTIKCYLTCIVITTYLYIRRTIKCLDVFG